MEKHELLQTCPIHESQRFLVPGFSIDSQKRLSIPGLIEQLQEVALLSTQNLGVSVFDLEPHNLGWVLLGQRIDLYERPKLAESCTIITAPVGFERVFTFRDFHVISADGQTKLASCSTTWMLMNLNSRKMATLPDWIKAIDKKTPPKEAHLSRASYKLVPPDQPIMTRTFQVGYHELDFNGHLTNPIYVRWMLEGLERPLLEERHLQQLSIQYAREARYGDELTVGITKTDQDGVYHHGLFRNKELIASLQTTFT